MKTEHWGISPYWYGNIIWHRTIVDNGGHAKALFCSLKISMADVHDKATRSYNMSRIKGKDTKPEMLVRRFLHANGFRYRLHAKDLPGKPDIVLPKYRTVIFVHGCFWHKHDGCRYFVVPKTRTEWWMDKIERNVSNDLAKQKALKNLGWKIVQIWECDLKSDKQHKTLDELLNTLVRIKKATA